MNRSYLPQPLKSVFAKVKNQLHGKDFNRLAHQAHLAGRKSDPDYIDPDDEPSALDSWYLIETHDSIRGESNEEGFYLAEDEEFRSSGLKAIVYVSIHLPITVRYVAVPADESHGSQNLTATALEKAAQTAGYSAEYAAQASKYLLMEMARDVGWVLNCQTAVQALRSVEKRFPLLVDVKRAYEEGSASGGGVVRHTEPQEWMEEEEEEEEEGQPNEMESESRFEPRKGWNHPRDVNVASNLERFAIMGDDGGLGNDIAFREGRLLVAGVEEEEEEEEEEKKKKDEEKPR